MKKEAKTLKKAYSKPSKSGIVVNLYQKKGVVFEEVLLATETN